MVASKILLRSQSGEDIEASCIPMSREMKIQIFSRSENIEVLGILAFETAKMMSGLISLYGSLSDTEIFILRNEILRSDGVTYLNSSNERFIVDLARAEKLEELDRAASFVTRLGKKCRNPKLKRFQHIYSELKLGIIDSSKLRFSVREMEKVMKRMDRYIKTTSKLYAESETLSGMEVSNRKRLTWTSRNDLNPVQKANIDSFKQNLISQKQRVQHLKVISLWQKSVDPVVTLMARAIYTIYQRICQVFDQDTTVDTQKLPFCPNRSVMFASEPLGKRPIKNKINPQSGPLHQSSLRVESDREITFCILRRNSYSCKLPKPSSTTLGGSGLAFCYAKVIILAEKFFRVPSLVTDVSRESLYEMLPHNLRESVRAKLSSRTNDVLNAGEWSMTVDGILEWLAPLAHDTVMWQAERTYESKKFDTKKTVLLIQTLHFSDTEKTEAAIVDVLVGLSYVLRCRNQSHRSKTTRNELLHC